MRRSVHPADRLITVFSIASSLVLGCTCGEDAVVPNHTATGEPTPPPALEFAPMEVTLQPAGTTSVTVDEVPITVGSGAIAVSGAFDFDRDGDRDVLFVALEGPAVRVLYAERNGEAYVAPAVVAERAEARVTIDGASVLCTPTAAHIEPLTMGVVVVSVDSACATSDASRARFVTAWVTPSDVRPRALESFSYLGDASGPVAEGGAGRPSSTLAGSHLPSGMTFAAHDRDQDTHDDLEVTVHVAAGADMPASTLVWMNRAAGFARQSEQPESSITSLANQAREHIARDAAAALRSAEQTIALREALCREAERPRFYLGDMPGVPCGTSSAAGRAYAMRAIALVRSLPSEPFSREGVPLLDRALATTLALDHEGVAVREGDRALLREAWMRVSSIDPEHFLVSAGPPASIPDGRAPRLSGVAFLDEEHVLIRDREPRVLTLATGELAATAHTETRVQDRDGAHVLAAIERRCEGTVLVIETTAGGARQEVRIDDREGPLTGGCPASLAEGFRGDDAGYRALGWTPQGILLVRGLELTLVPLDANANALGAPQVLSENAPLPAPIPLGAAVADGHAYALAMPFGILVIDRAAHTIALYRDDNFAMPSGEPIDAALSPSGHRAAWFAGGAVRWANLERVDAVTTLPAPGPTGEAAAPLTPPPGASNPVPAPAPAPAPEPAPTTAAEATP